MKLDFPGLEATLSPEVLVLHSRQPLHILASAVVGGGLGQTRYILNRHVDKNYHHPDPVSDLSDFARSRGITEPFVGLMTAVYLADVGAVTLYDAELTVTAVVTAGVIGNPTCAGLSAPAVLKPGTINMILLLTARLTPAAMVNAVITATEAKTHVLLGRQFQTPEGHLATGTSTDSMVVACTGEGELLPYAGPATRIGWLIGQGVRQALEIALSAKP